MPSACFSHLVTNPRMKQVLSDCGWLESATLGHYELKLAVYHGCCTSGPTTWYKKGGVGLRWWGGAGPHGANVEQMKSSLSKCGMVPVFHCTGQEANTKFSRANGPQYLRPGDIGSMLSSDSAHGVMWTGQDWRSDCIERDGPYPYRSVGRGGDWTFILWRHPDLQEPGTDIMGGGFGNAGGSTGGTTGGTAAPMKEFNIQEFEVKEDEKGKYTEEPVLMSVANHIHIGGAGSTGGSIGAYSGEIGDESIFVDKTTDIEGALRKLRRPEVQKRAIYCAKWLATNVKNFNIMYACAVIGVFVDENGCDPAKGMEYEKAGKGAKGTEGGGYGAGIGSWTGLPTKRKVLASIGKGPDVLIESLSLDEQLQMVKAEWESGDKKHSYMWQAKDLVHASIIAVFMTHGSGYFQKALDAGGGDIYSAGFHKAINDESIAQQQRLQRQFGRDSPYYHGLFHKRYLIAKELYLMCGGSST